MMNYFALTDGRRPKSNPFAIFREVSTKTEWSLERWDGSTWVEDTSSLAGHFFLGELGAEHISEAEAKRIMKKTTRGKIEAGTLHTRIRIIAEHDGGRGGVIEMPIASESIGTILENTATQSEGTLDVDSGVFSEMVGNFERKPGPVPVYFGHEDRGRPETIRYADTPAAAQILGIWMESNQLWGRIDLGPRAWDLLVEQRGFYSFSIEALQDPPFAQGVIPGWVLTGGVFTNSPAFDVSIAASRHSPPPWGTEDEMTREEVNKLQAENTTLKSQTVKLIEENKALKEDNKRLHAEGTAAEVRRICSEAIQAGKVPAFFEGYDTDPMKFLGGRFGGNLDSLKASVSAMPALTIEGGNGPDVSSGGSGRNVEPEGDTDREKFDNVIDKIRAEDPKLSYSDALDRAKVANPRLWASISSSYANPSLRAG